MPQAKGKREFSENVMGLTSMLLLKRCKTSAYKSKKLIVENDCNFLVLHKLTFNGLGLKTDGDRTKFWFVVIAGMEKC